MKVTAITATAGRHMCIERSIRLFLDQTYENAVQLIYNNSEVDQVLDEDIPNGKIILVNNGRDLETKDKYQSLGAIYRDSLKFVPEGTDIITFWDDDDQFLPTHIEEGVKGYLRGGKSAYKPKFSWYKHRGGFDKMENNLEPSIFVSYEHIKKYGFSDKTTEQHLHWLEPLIAANDIYVDPDGPSTLIYDWSQEIPTFKTSGDFHNPNNFNNYRRNSQDHGDGIITPISKYEAATYYRKIVD